MLQDIRALDFGLTIRRDSYLLLSAMLDHSAQQVANFKPYLVKFAKPSSKLIYQSYKVGSPLNAFIMINKMTSH